MLSEDLDEEILLLRNLLKETNSEFDKLGTLRLCSGDANVDSTKAMIDRYTRLLRWLEELREYRMDCHPKPIDRDNTDCIDPPQCRYKRVRIRDKDAEPMTRQCVIDTFTDTIYQRVYTPYPEILNNLELFDIMEGE